MSDAAVIDRLVVRAEHLIDQRRTALGAEFGWTHLHATARLRVNQRQLVVEGDALLPRIIEELRQDLRPMIPCGWTLSLDLRPVPGGPWRYLGQMVTPLQRQLPSTARPATLATELLVTDGPVQCLARRNGARLVRAIDGTVGWTTAPLGPLAAPPSTAPVRFSVSRMQRYLRSYLGVPYLLGGATRGGIDCSALAQRSLRHASNAIIPRHSLDQLRSAGPAARPLGEPGDLLYAWPRGQGACHVGVVLAGSRGHQRVVVHASSSRRRVIEEPLDRFLSRADRVAHAEPAQFLDRAPCLPER